MFTKHLHKFGKQKQQQMVLSYDDNIIVSNGKQQCVMSGQQL